LDTGFGTGLNAILVGTALADGAAEGDQVRKIAIRMRMSATAAVPYFTSLMKPS
jgi:hypothetical protein